MRDIDATIQDSKAFLYFEETRGSLEPGEFLHNISARVTFNSGLIVQDIAAALDDTPFTFCQGGAANAHRLVGQHLMQGWRKALTATLGGTVGCTHLKEVLWLKEPWRRRP